MNARGQGRKSRPSHLKILRGEKNKDRINTKEPKPLPKRPPCPRFLGKEARKIWRYLAPQLERTGQLTRIDLGVFAAFCQVWGRWVEAEKLLAEKGILYRTPNGNVITSPVLWVINKCISQINSLGSQLGLDPASRTRIKVELEGEKDEFEELLD